MANLELEIISNVVKNSDLATLQKRNITAELFQTEEAREAYKWLHEQYTDPGHPGEVPDADRLLRYFPNFEYRPSSNSLNALINELYTTKIRAEATQISSDLQQWLDEGISPQEVLGHVLPKLQDLNALGAGDDGLLLAHSVNRLREEYERKKNVGGVTGLPYPFEHLNKYTGGMQREQFLVIYGRPKQGKCVVEGERVMEPSGAMTPIQDLGDVCTVPSFTEVTGRFRWAPAIKTYSGMKRCAELLVEGGAFTRTSYTHPYLTPEGYKKLEELRVGDYVALSQQLPETEPLGGLDPVQAFSLGVRGGTSVPAEVFTASPKAVGAYLSAQGVQLDGKTVWVCPNRDVARDVQHLLRRRGLYATVTTRHPLGAFVVTVLEHCTAPVDRQLVWERVMSITDLGELPCWDLSIADGQDENFVVEDFVVHNSWLALLFAAHAYMSGARVLAYSKEMSKEQLLGRLSAIVGEVDSEKLRMGCLSTDDERRYFEVMGGLQQWEEENRTDAGHRRALCIIGDGGKKQASSVDTIASIGKNFEPDLILVDGFYLMRDGRTASRTADWKNIAHISQDIKGMAQFLRVPVLGTSQANRMSKDSAGDDLSELSFADSIGQDADMVMRTFLGKMNGVSTMAITVPGLREGKQIPPFAINFNPGYDFAVQSSHLDIKAFLQAKEAQEAAEEAKAKGGKQGPRPGAKDVKDKFHGQRKPPGIR